MGSLLEKLIGFVNGDENVDVPKETASAPQDTTTLQENLNQESKIEDVETFLSEMYQYYANDIYRLEAKIINPEACEDSEVKLLKILVLQKDEALKKIRALMNAVIREKAALTELERKSSYSFYDQLKRDTTEKVKLNVFKIFAHIKSINVAKELDEIIVTRINKLRSDWNISPDVKIIENSDFRIVDMTDELETYTFGTIQKNFFTSEEVKLSDEELDAIDAMNIVLDLDNLPEYIWIRVTSIERWQIDLLQKTAIFPNTYELNAPAISYDIISKTDIENYIKGILKILVPRARYLVFSIIIPNESIKTSIANFVTISKNNVTIQNKTAFMLFERNKLPSESYLIKYIDTLLLPTKFSFKTSDVLRQEFLPQFIDY